MASPVAGPHHCIGGARAATDLMYRSLRARCETRGTLSLLELDEFYATFVDCFARGFHLFESIHRQCMCACAGSTDTPLASGTILSTLLRACLENSARHGFSLQVEHFGDPWLKKLFDVFAQYIRDHVNATADVQLTDAYADAATSLKGALSIPDLLKRDDVARILRACVAPFEAPAAGAAIAATAFSDYFNNHIATTEQIVGPHLSKITNREAAEFLRLVPIQVSTLLGPVEPDGTDWRVSVAS